MASPRLLLLLMLSLSLFGCTNPLENRVIISSELPPAGSEFSAMGIFDSKDCIFTVVPHFKFGSFTVKDCESKALNNETVYAVHGTVCGNTSIDIGMTFGVLRSGAIVSGLLAGRSIFGSQVLNADDVDEDAEVWSDIPVVCADATEERQYYQLVEANYASLEGAVKEQSVPVGRKTDLHCTGSTVVERNISETEMLPKDITGSPGFIDAIGWGTKSTKIFYFNQQTLDTRNVSGDVKTDELMVYSAPGHGRLLGVPMRVDYAAQDRLSFMGVYLTLNNGSRIRCETDSLAKDYFALCPVDENASLSDTSDALLLLYDYDRMLVCYSRIPTQP
ncbi:hypothetical protein H0O00_04200 [Candidatus Micrarchaeota archaeon]|nr:hypothetical protein [Candidatus Micrarchaeota archaeon]